MFDFAALINQVLSQMPELTTPAQSSAPASTPASAVSTVTAPANSISRALVGGWQPPPNMSGAHTAGPTWQDYENYYNQKQSVPTAYSVPAPVQQAAPTPTPAPTQGGFTAEDLNALAAILGKAWFAQGGITGSLPYTQRRD